MKKSLSWVLFGFCIFLVACEEGTSDPASNTTANSTEDLSTVPVEAIDYSSYFKMDLSSNCQNNIIGGIQFDRNTELGNLSSLPCYSQNTNSTSIDPNFVSFHSRFQEYLVYQGDIFVDSEHFKPLEILEPLFYCQLDDNETDVELFRVVFDRNDSGEYSHRHEYRNPVTYYYDGGGGGSNISLIDGGATIQITDNDPNPQYGGSYDVSIDTTTGDRLNGFQSQATLRVSGVVVELDLKCFIDSAY